MRVNYTTLAIALMGIMAAAVLLALGHDQVAAITAMVTTLMAAQGQQALRAEATRSTDAATVTVPRILPIDTPTPVTRPDIRPKLYANPDAYSVPIEDGIDIDLTKDPESSRDPFGPGGPK